MSNIGRKRWYMSNEELGFDTEFMTDDEVEQMLDSLVTTVGEAAAIDDSKTSIIPQALSPSL